MTEGTDPLAEIARMALDAVIPGLADAAVVFVTENLLWDGPTASIRPAEHDDSGQLAVRRILTWFPDREQNPSVFPPGEAVALAADSPYAQCLRDGKPVVFSQPDGQMLDQVGPGGRAVFSRYTSFLAVPMTSGSTTAGLIALARAPGRDPFADGDIDGITRLAALAGTGITSTVDMERHQSVSSALRRGLLAGKPPQPDRLDVAGRCLPAHGHLIGGDWYDLVPLPGGRTGVIVGDVMGHGPEAAAVMAQLRAAARTLAQLDLKPAELLGRLDRLTATLPGMPLATCVYAVIDPGWQSGILSAAGHLPPVLALPERGVRTLDIPGGPSVGIGPSDYGQTYVKLRPGAILALYTDGLVETRTRSYDQGITALQAGLSRADGPLDATCDTLISTLARYPEDDVTLILARIA